MAGGTIGDVHYAHQSNIKYQEYAAKGAASALDPFMAKDKNFKLTDWPQCAQEAMKANCDNIDNPEGYTYPANFRLTQPGAIQEIMNKYLNDIADLKQEPTPAVMKELNNEVQKIMDMPRL